MKNVTAEVGVKKRTGCRTLPWGIPALTGKRQNDSIESHMLVTRVEQVNKPCVKLALDAIGKEFLE